MIVLLLRRRTPFILPSGLDVSRGRDADVFAFPFVVLREPDHVVMAEEGLNGIVYDLAVNVELYVQERATSTSDNPDTRIGTAFNALYGRMLSTVLANPSLGGLCDHVLEGSLVMEASTESYATPVAVGGLGLNLRYIDVGTSNRRAQVLTALATYLAANVDPSDLTRREVMLAALKDQLRAELDVSIGVERNRRAKLDAKAPTLRHVSLRDGSQVRIAGEEEVLSISHYLAQPTLELTVRASTEDGLGTAMDALYGDVRTALYSDRTLGGAAFTSTDQELNVVEATEQGMAPVLRATMTLDVEYLTDESDPTRVAA